MENADKTMIKNLEKKFGKSLNEWIKIVKKEKFEKHGKILKFLKNEHDFTHGYATLVALKARGTDAGSADSTNQLVDNQYKGKETLRPIYEKILKEVLKFGIDIEVAPKKVNVSLRRKRQFALVQPSTKTRIDLGLKLKDKEIQGRLEGSGPFGLMCTHRVKISAPKDIDNEVLSWLKEAYEKAG